MISMSQRMALLPSYKINELAASKKRLEAAGRAVLDLGAGDADFPPPAIATAALHEALGDPAMSRYAFQVGLLEFRQAVARYMKRRFAVVVDPVTEVLPLIGSKNGLAHLPLAVCNPGDVCVIPEPGYPGYMGAYLADADVERYRLREEQAFLLELADIPAARLAKASLVFMNYPNNPTTAVAPVDFLERTIEICRRYDIALAYDNPYCELTFDGYRAPSILELSGARDVALEFHSFSKSFCMTGWRLGWAVGSADLIALLSKVKSYVDTGVFLAIQRAGAVVLDQAESLVEPLVRQFEERRNVAVAAFNQAGIAVETPRATMYLWLRLPEGVPSAEFASGLLEHDGVLVMPGSAFGEAGEGYLRIALTVVPDLLRDAAARVGRALSRFKDAGVPA